MNRENQKTKMENRKIYSTPELKCTRMELGVYGTYNGGGDNGCGGGGGWDDWHWGGHGGHGGH
jgi:hypothetical protein